MTVGLADVAESGSHCKNDTEGSSGMTAERVLIVEDDPAARVGLEQLIKSWGVLAESAADGEAALEKVTSFRPAIVITENTTYLVEPGWRLEPTQQGAVWFLRD